jgi:hypothetical protein
VADPSMTKQWYEFRRHLAWTILSLWMLMAVAPIAALATIWLSGRPLTAPATEVVIRLLLPAIFFTGGAFFAVNILRTKDPDRSRTQAWRLVACLCAGLVAFLIGASVYGR